MLYHEGHGTPGKDLYVCQKLLVVLKEHYGWNVEKGVEEGTWI